MKRGLISIIIIAFAVLVSLNFVMGAATNISECVYIDDPGEYTINTSFDTSSLVGGATVCLWINASNVLLNGTGKTLTSSNSSYYGIYVVNCSNVTIKNLNLTGFYQGIALDNATNSSITGNNLHSSIDTGIVISYDSNNNKLIFNTVASNGSSDGIYIYNSSNNNITSNNISENYYGISLSGSSSNNITSNTVSNNTYGIYLYSSSDNKLTLNNASGNYLGISLSESSKNVLSGNNMSGGRFNFWIDATDNDDFNNTIDTSNLVDYSHKLYYNFSISSYIYNPSTAPSAGAVYCGLCNKINVSDLNLSLHVQAGIFFFNVSNSTVRNVTSYNNYFGFYLDYSSNNNLTSSTAGNNTYGIAFYKSPSNNITLNNASNNYYGIELDYSSKNILSKNNMSNNTYDNFGVAWSSNDDFNNTIDTSNLVDYSYKLYYNFSIANYTYNSSTASDAGAVYCGLCSNITVKDLNLSHYMQAGIVFFNVSNSLVQNVTLNGNLLGIYLDSSRNNTFVNDTLAENDSLRYSLWIDGNANGTSFIDSTIAKYYILDPGSLISFKDSNYGKIDFLTPINGTGTNLSSDVRIGSNSAFANSTAISGLNQSANITLYNIATTYTTPAIYKDSSACSASVCTNFTSLNAGNVTFSVTGFSTYSIVETYSAPASDTPGGGGGTPIVLFWNMTYVSSDEQFNQGYTKALPVKSRIQVKVNNIYHYIGVVEVPSSSATINVSSAPQQAVFLTGETKKFEVSNDSYYDIAVTLNGIANSKANITVLSIHNAVVQTPSQPSENITGTELINETPSASKKGWLVPLIIAIAVVIVVVAGGLAALFFFKRKKIQKRNRGRIVRKSITKSSSTRSNSNRRVSEY